MDHPILYTNPTPDQLKLVNVTMLVDVLQKEFPKLFEILVKNTKECWPHWSSDEKRGCRSPKKYAETSEDHFIIVPLDSEMSKAFLVEDYVQPIPGHMALFMEQNGFTNVTLVFTKDGLIG